LALTPKENGGKTERMLPPGSEDRSIGWAGATAGGQKTKERELLRGSGMARIGEKVFPFNSKKWRDEKQTFGRNWRY